MKFQHTVTKVVIEVDPDEKGKLAILRDARNWVQLSDTKAPAESTAPAKAPVSPAEPKPAPPPIKPAVPTPGNAAEAKDLKAKEK